MAGSGLANKMVNVVERQGVKHPAWGAENFFLGEVANQPSSLYARSYADTCQDQSRLRDPNDGDYCVRWLGGEEIQAQHTLAGRHMLDLPKAWESPLRDDWHGARWSPYTQMAAAKGEEGQIPWADASWMGLDPFRDRQWTGAPNIGCFGLSHHQSPWYTKHLGKREFQEAPGRRHPAQGCVQSQAMAAAEGTTAVLEVGL